MSVVYLVIGETGNHDTLVHWSVKAFLDEGVARKYAESLNEWVFNQDIPNLTWKQIRELECPLDPSFEWYEPGTGYTVASLPLDTTSATGITAKDIIAKLKEYQ